MLYLIRMEGTNYIKIGIAENPKKRLSTLAGGNPIQLTLVFSVRTSDSYWQHEDAIVEAEIHAELSAYRVRGEWFNLGQMQVESIIEVLTDRFQRRPVWDQWRQQTAPAGYIPPFRPRPLLSP